MKNINKEAIEEAVRLAQESSSAAEPSLREKTFEVVLNHLLGHSESMTPLTSPPSQVNPRLPVSTGIITGLNFSKIASQLGISDEQAAELYELKGDTLHLAIKPTGTKLSDKQRNLAHALLVGYRLGLDVKEVSVTKLSEAAEEWNVRDKNFGRNINDEYSQMKGAGRGTRPIFSLAPGAIDRLRDQIVSMLG